MFKAFGSFFVDCWRVDSFLALRNGLFACCSTCPAVKKWYDLGFCDRLVNGQLALEDNVAHVGSVFRRIQLPLFPGLVRTCFASQGLTMDYVIMVCDMPWSMSDDDWWHYLYVKLSRVRVAVNVQWFADIMGFGHYLTVQK